MRISKYISEINKINGLIQGYVMECNARVIYVNNTLHGIEIRYYNSGIIYCINQLVNGRTHGIADYYNHDLILSNKSLYQNGKFVKIITTL
jgi:antitoxin component YwqK of YwqJK toxin-antitoxin module